MPVLDNDVDCDHEEEKVSVAVDEIDFVRENVSEKVCESVKVIEDVGEEIVGLNVEVRVALADID